MKVKDTSQEEKQSKSTSFWHIDRPWKVTVIAVIFSLLVTAMIMQVLQIGSLLMGLAIAFVCSALGGYGTSLLIFRYQRVIEEQNRQLAQRTAELTEANASLKETNAELKAFAHTVAHNLKTPLSNVAGFAALLRERRLNVNSDETGKILHTIESSSLNMVKVIDEILLLARMHNQAVEQNPLDMVAVITQALERLNPEVVQHEAEIVLADEWPTAVGYAPWVEEVWVNYLSNGLKYGGVPPKLELGSTVQENGQVCFWIRDNGPGIAAEEQAQLFTEFTRLSKRQVEGTGLGLSIVRRIVEKLGGSVGVSSEVGRGSTFYFTLPADQDRLYRNGRA